MNHTQQDVSQMCVLTTNMDQNQLQRQFSKNQNPNSIIVTSFIHGINLFFYPTLPLKAEDSFLSIRVPPMLPRAQQKENYTHVQI